MRAHLDQLATASATNAAKLRAQLIAGFPGGQTAYEKAVSAVGDTMRIQTRVHPQSLLGMLADGYSKVTHELPERKALRWGAQSYNDARNDYESGLGIRQDRIIYGTLADGPSMSGMNPNHGEIVVVYKQERVSNRVTVTPGDTLIDWRSHRNPFGESAMTWNSGAKDLIVATNTHSARACTPYCEAQIFGGVTLEDIAAIEIPKGPQYDDLAAKVVARMPWAKVVRDGHWETGAP
jgi:hypothetical protein